MSEHSSTLVRPLDYVPVEILLTIFERLDGDKEALRSCALVCHEWLPISRSQLFRNIHFEPPPRGYDDCFRRFLSFFRTSKTSGSDLGRHVEELTFTSCRRLKPYAPYGFDKYHLPSDDAAEAKANDMEPTKFVNCQLDVLMSLGSVFPRLKRLTLVKLTIIDELGDLRRGCVPSDWEREDEEPDEEHDSGTEGDADEGSSYDHQSDEEEGGENDGDGDGDEDALTDDEGSSDAGESSDDSSGLSDFGDFDGVDDPIEVLPDGCAPLAELRINEVYSAFGTYRDIFQVICSFTEIGRLSLEFLPWGESKHVDSNPMSWFVNVTPSHRPVIRTLDLEDPLPFLVKAFHDFLRRSGALEGSLRSLKFRGGMDGMKEIEAFKPLLVDAGPRLGELHLNLWPRMYKNPSKQQTVPDMLYATANSISIIYRGLEPLARHSCFTLHGLGIAHFADRRTSSVWYHYRGRLCIAHCKNR